MKPKRIPPRWLSSLVFLAGLYVVIYLFATVGDISRWIFPTGIVAALMMVAGAAWFFRPPRSSL